MKHTMGSTHRFFLWAFCCLVTILSAKLALAVNPTTSNLQQKMGQIASLHERITEKTDQGTRIRQQFAKQRQAIAEEIKDEQERMGTASYEKATQCARIDYNLRLLQQYDGYISAIDQRLTYFQTLGVELAHLFQQAEDDVKIIETFNDMDIADLMIQIDRILVQYLPEAEKPLIWAEELRLPQLEDVWNDIMSRH